MLVGKRVRLNRLFNQDSGRMVTIAIDHTIGYGIIPGLENIQKTVDVLADARPDAMMMHKGIVERCFEAHAGRVGLILQSAAASPFQLNRERPAADVSEAVALGADAISVAITVGGEDQPQQTEHLGRIVRDARLMGMPVVAHCYPKGEFIPEDERFNVENVLYAARVGAELGVDIIKTYYTGSPETFAKVVEGVPARVVAAGGPKVSDLGDMLRAVKDIMSVGAAGITYGRNVWQDPNPAGVIAALRAVVHENVAPSEAVEIYSAKK